MEKDEQAFASAPPQGFLRRHRSVIITVLAILVAVFLLVRFVHYKQQQQAQTAAANRGGGFRRKAGTTGPTIQPVAVSVATVASGGITVRIPALGTITPLATVTVKTQISGTLQKILFTEGQLVKAGDPLALT